MMGTYTERLMRRNKDRSTKTISLPDVEYLVSVALKRDDKVHHGFKAHYELRYSLGDKNPLDPMPGDVDGFYTSEGRFVDRREAMKVGELAEQCSAMGRKLLSSDIRWRQP